MRAVNLLPRDVERQRSDGGRAPVLVAGGGIAAVTAAAAVLFMCASGSVSDQRSQLESVESAIARIPTAGQPAVAPGTIAQERTDRVTALAAALTTRVPVDRLLRELAYVLPEDAWLTGLTASAPTCRRADRCSRRPPRRLPGPASRSRAPPTRTSRSPACSRARGAPDAPDVRLTASARVEPAAPAAEPTGKKKKKAKKQKTVVTFSITASFRAGGPA